MLNRTLGLIVGIAAISLTGQVAWAQRDAASKIDGAAYTMTTIGIVGAYITGNTAQKIKAPGAEGNA